MLLAAPPSTDRSLIYFEGCLYQALIRYVRSVLAESYRESGAEIGSVVTHFALKIEFATTCNPRWAEDLATTPSCVNWASCDVRMTTSLRCRAAHTASPDLLHKRHELGGSSRMDRGTPVTPDLTPRDESRLRVESCGLWL